MARKRGFLGRVLNDADRAVRQGVEKADGIIDGAVDTGSAAVTEAAQSAKDLKEAAVQEMHSVGDKGIRGIRGGAKQAREIIAPHDGIKQLERLGNMWQEGILTDEEFREAKRKLLDRL